MAESLRWFGLRPEAALCTMTLALAACAPKAAVHVAPGADVSRYLRVGVLPFEDPAGQGLAVADAVARGLLRLGFDTVNVGIMERAFSTLNLQPGSELSMQDLLEIRRLTEAAAIVVGSVDTPAAGRPRRISLLMIEAHMGEPVVRASFPIPASRNADIEEAADAVERALWRLALRREEAGH